MDNRQQVGEWIAQRRSQLAMTQAQLAAVSQIGVRTIGNAERGKRELRASLRGQLEEALSWDPGSLTVAYLRGVRPGRGAVVEAVNGEDPMLLEILGADLSVNDKAALIALRERQLSDLRAEISRRSSRRLA